MERLHPTFILTILALGPACMLLGCSDEQGPDGGIERLDEGSVLHERDDERAPVSISAPASVDRDAATRTAIARFETLTKDLDDHASVVPRRIDRDRRGHAFVRLTQHHRSIPVLGGELIVQLREDGSVVRHVDGLVRGLDVDPVPRLTAHAAVDRAVDEHGGPALTTGTPSATLLVVRHQGRDHLAYRVQIAQLEAGREPHAPVVLVDAHSGERLASFESLLYAMPCDDDPTSLCDEDAAVFDMGHGTDWTAAVLSHASDPMAVTVQEHVALTLGFFWELGRDSYDDLGRRVDSYMHWGLGEHRAAFFPEEGSGEHRILFGDGNGPTWGAPISLDYVAHELSHGVTFELLGWLVTGESRSINEATSDIFAAATDAFVNGGVSESTWAVFEDAYTPGIPGDAARYMDDPTLDGKSRDHYSELDPAGTTGSAYANAGIINLFFYLLSEGGGHPDPQHHLTDVDGIGIEAAAELWYQTLLLTPSGEDHLTIQEIHATTFDACVDLYGDLGAPECIAVNHAWCEVGLGVCGQVQPSDEIVVEGYRLFTGDPHDWWIDTGLDVSAGQSVALSCLSGAVLPWGGHYGFDCGGDPGLLWEHAVAPGCSFGSLVAKLGESGTPECVGPASTFAASASGRLYVAFNDGVDFADNSGSWLVSLELGPVLEPALPTENPWELGHDPVLPPEPVAW